MVKTQVSSSYADDEDDNDVIDQPHFHSSQGTWSTGGGKF